MRLSPLIPAGLITLTAGVCLASGLLIGPPEPLKIGPVTYFEDRCSRCHGPQGTFYGDDFGKGLTEAALHKVVEDMCRVQGDRPLIGRDLEAQVAYHRSLIAKEPFLAITLPASEGILSGETAQKTEVTVSDGRRRLTAVVKDGTWTCKLPAEFKPSSVRAVKGAAVTTLDVRKMAFSHSLPIKTVSSPEKPNRP